MCHRNDLFLPQFFGTDERAPVDAAKLRSFANGGDLIESVSKQLKSKQKRELLSDAVREAQLAEAGLLTAANALSALGLRVALGNDRLGTVVAGGGAGEGGRVRLDSGGQVEAVDAAALAHARGAYAATAEGRRFAARQARAAKLAAAAAARADKAAAAEKVAAARAEAKALKKAQGDAQGGARGGARGGVKRKAGGKLSKAEMKRQRAEEEERKAEKEYRARLPKRARSAYHFFAESKREEVVAGNAGLDSAGVTKLLGALWRGLDAPTKAI